MASATVVAVDCMGGDRGPSIPIKASLAVLAKRRDISIKLVGDAAILNALIPNHSFDHRLEVVHATQTIEMTDQLAVALRKKTDSSMKVAIDLVATGQCDAIVSGGNTAALMALARYVLKMLPGIDRPAIIAPLPTLKGFSYVLDLGANVNSDSETLFQFGVMGSVMMNVIHDVAHPKVALLNVGEEELKGNDQVKHAAQLLSQCGEINYSGFIEGDQIFKGFADVVVCDGFVGNIMLKSSEGMSALVQTFYHEEFQRSWWGRCLLALSSKMLKNVNRRCNPDSFNGASLIGINGSVIKSHGAANAIAFESAIETAIFGAQKQIPQKVKQVLEQLHFGGVCL